MRFLHVNHRYAPFVGGSERYVQEVSEAAVTYGHDVTVVTSNAFDLEYFWDPARKAVDAAASERINGVQVYRVPIRHVPASSFLFRGGRRLMGELSRAPIPAMPFSAVASHQPWLPGLAETLIDAGPSDLIHATNLGLEGLAIAAQRVAAEQDAPFVLTPFIHLGPPGDHDSRRYVSMPHQVELLRHADVVLVMTEMEGRFVEKHGVPSSRIVVAGAGVDVAEVTGGDAVRFRERHAIRGFLVASIGPLSREKGSMDLVQAVISMRRRGVDVEAVLAGPSMSAFDRWFGKLDPRDKNGIHLLGFVDADVKRDLLAAMDAFVMPSRSESFGIVYLEAWANRKPVVAARAGAVPELVMHGENGILVPFGRSDAVQQAILRLMNDSAAAATFGDRGASLVTARYQWQSVVARVFRGYEIGLGIPVMEAGR